MNPIYGSNNGNDLKVQKYFKLCKYESYQGKIRESEGNKMNLTIVSTTDTLALARSIVRIESEVTSLAYELNKVRRKANDFGIIANAKVDLFNGHTINVTALP